MSTDTVESVPMVSELDVLRTLLHVFAEGAARILLEDDPKEIEEALEPELRKAARMLRVILERHKREAVQEALRAQANRYRRQG